MVLMEEITGDGEKVKRKVSCVRGVVPSKSRQKKSTRDDDDDDRQVGNGNARR